MKRFLTAAALLSLVFASPASAQSFAQTADMGNTADTTAVTNLIKSHNPAFVVTAGDNCYGSSPSLATQVGSHWSTFVSGGKFWPSLGNHEYSDACAGTKASGYFAYFTLPNNERYYTKVIGSVALFIINSASSEPDGDTATSKQALWLKAQLAASTAPWNIVVFHHTAYSSGTKHKSTTRMRWPFELWGADAVVSGHEHNYERVLIDANADGVKMPYFTNGLGGESKYPFGTPITGSAKRYNSAFGALFITATSTSLAFTFRNVSNTVIDSYTITHGAAATKAAFDFRVCC